jgi:polyhydroxyalkanoate synthesis regulator protein
MAEANFKMMQNAAEAFIPAASKSPKPETSDDLAEMRAQMAAMQKKLDEMSK